METITIMLYGAAGTVPDPSLDPEDLVLVTVRHSRGESSEPEFYDFRWSAPVSDQVICELEQLVEVLIQAGVARRWGLQPALF